MWDVAGAMMSEILREELLQSGALASAALLAALFTIHFLVGRALKQGASFPPLVVRRWTANLRNLLILIAIVGLMMIWAPQLRTFALSLTAFAVASVIAMKELILCFSGSALRTLSRAYSVGDYVEIGGRRGEVMDINLLVTRLREFEKQDGSFRRTGKEVILPHSLLFNSPVRVEGHAGERVRHVFSMTFEPDADIFAQRAAIEEAALENVMMGPTTVLGLSDKDARVRAEAQLAKGSRVADIGQYNVKGTTNVNFDIGKAVLSTQAQNDLCATASTAEGMKNALLLIVGYTDSTGDSDYNQQLSEKRAARVVNYLQQNCGWKPYRMLTPTGMSEAQPLTTNDTPEGRAQNRRVEVNILVSKGLDGL
ncbi:MAG: hypothetical protein B7Z20_05715 [Sphingobium sp. 32-64-5]|nr:MAG: hypothetical protein B7Z20_05715 [Sphingobium sp. 32-64-5]